MNIHMYIHTPVLTYVLTVVKSCVDYFNNYAMYIFKYLLILVFSAPVEVAVPSFLFL